MKKLKLGRRAHGAHARVSKLSDQNGQKMILLKTEDGQRHQLTQAEAILLICELSVALKKTV